MFLWENPLSGISRNPITSAWAKTLDLVYCKV